MSGDLFFDPDEPVFTEAGEVVKRRERRRQPTPYERALFDRCVTLGCLVPPYHVWGPQGSRWRAQQETAARGKMLAMLGAFAAGQHVPPAFAEVARLDGEVALACAVRDVIWTQLDVLAHSVTDGKSTDNWIAAWTIRDVRQCAIEARQPDGKPFAFFASATDKARGALLLCEFYSTGQRAALDVLRDHLEEHGVIIPPASAWRLR